MHELGMGGLGEAGQDSGAVVLEASLSPRASAWQTRDGLAALSSRQRVGCDVAYSNNKTCRGPEDRSSLPLLSHSSGNVHRSSCGLGLWLVLRKQRQS